MIIFRIIFVGILPSLLVFSNGCAPKVLLQFRYVESHEPVAESEVYIRPSLAFANPLLPFKKKKLTTSANGEIELPLNWKPDSEAKHITLTGPHDSFHEWYMGDKELVTPFFYDYWIGEKEEWVEGYTDTRKYRSVEVRLVEKE